MSKQQESSDPEEVHGILNTLLVPMDPPNRFRVVVRNFFRVILKLLVKTAPLFIQVLILFRVGCLVLDPILCMDPEAGCVLP